MKIKHLLPFFALLSLPALAQVQNVHVTPSGGNGGTLTSDSTHITVPSGGIFTIAPGATITNSGTATGFGGGTPSGPAGGSLAGTYPNPDAITLLNGAAGTTIIDGSLQQLIDSASVLSADWTNRSLTNSVGATTVDWSNLHLIAFADTSVDWGNYDLYSSGETPSINWSTRITSDGGGNPSIEWDARQLIAASSFISLDWASKLTYDASGQQSIDWDSRDLKDSSSSISLAWESRRLYDSGTVLSVDWGGRNLYDNISNNRSVDWNNRNLCDSIGSVLVGIIKQAGSGWTAATANVDYASPAIVTNSSPTTGSTVNSGTSRVEETLYITPSGTLLALTVSLPASSNSRVGQIIRVFITQIITTSTFNVSGGGTIIGSAPVTSAINSSVAFQCVSTASTGTWIRLQ